MEPLSKEEKVTIALTLNVEKLGSSAWDYLAWIGPTSAFFAYALHTQDLIAMGVAYVSLFGVALWHYFYSVGHWKHLPSAIRKYEDACNALQKPDSDG